MSTRDYKHKANARPRRERATKPRNAPRRWPWFVSGFVCGLLVAFVAYLKTYSPETLQLVASQSALRDEAKRTPKSAAEENGKPRFEFYTLLPEMEVAVPERELQAAAERAKPAPKPAVAAPVATAAAPPAPVPAASDASTFMMQVASFKTLQDADRLKASLALIGLVASIQTVTVNDTDTYFRVRVGPYTDIDRLNEARARLREQNFEPLVLKVRG